MARKEKAENTGIRFGRIAALYYEMKGEKPPNQMEMIECFFPGLVIHTKASDGQTKIAAEFVDSDCQIQAVRYKGKLYSGDSKRVSQILGRLTGTAAGNQEKERKSAELIQKNLALRFAEDMELTPALQENMASLLWDFDDEELEIFWDKTINLISELTKERRMMDGESRREELFPMDNEVFDDLIYNAAYQIELRSFQGLCNAYLWLLVGGLLRNAAGRVLRFYDSSFLAIRRQISENGELEDKLNNLFFPEEYEYTYSGDDLYKRFPGVEWYCDECNAYLNEQEGFDDRLPEWSCQNCGYVNRLDIEEIYDNEEDAQNEVRPTDPVKFADALERRRIELEEEAEDRRKREEGKEDETS